MKLVMIRYTMIDILTLMSLSMLKNVRCNRKCVSHGTSDKINGKIIKEDGTK